MRVLVYLWIAKTLKRRESLVNKYFSWLHSTSSRSSPRFFSTYLALSSHLMSYWIISSARILLRWLACLCTHSSKNHACPFHHPIPSTYLGRIADNYSAFSCNTECSQKRNSGTACSNLHPSTRPPSTAHYDWKIWNRSKPLLPIPLEPLTVPLGFQAYPFSRNSTAWHLCSVSDCVLPTHECLQSCQSQ